MLLHLAEVKMVVVPKYDEVSVKNIYPMIKGDPELFKYFPNDIPKGRQRDREYMFNVLNTKRPEYVKKIVDHAARLRNTAADQDK